MNDPTPASPPLLAPRRCSNSTSTRPSRADRQGRWTREHGRRHDHADTSRRPVPKAVSAPAARVWESRPNAEFRNRLATAEGNAHKPNFGYEEVNEKAGALGFYQMTPVALQATGMTDANGSWTGKYGVHSRAEFLTNPEAQENARQRFFE